MKFNNRGVSNTVGELLMIGTVIVISIIILSQTTALISSVMNRESTVEVGLQVEYNSNDSGSEIMEIQVITMGSADKVLILQGSEKVAELDEVGESTQITTESKLVKIIQIKNGEKVLIGKYDNR